MSDVIIYGIPGSPYVRMPLLACEEKGAPYRLHALAFGESKQPAPPWLTLSGPPLSTRGTRIAVHTSERLSHIKVWWVPSGAVARPSPSMVVVPELVLRMPPMRSREPPARLHW